MEKSKSFLGRNYSNLEEESALNQLTVYCFHVSLAGNELIIGVDVMHSDIPMLLSLESLKKARVKLDVENDEAEILGARVSLNFTSSGHYCIPVDEVGDTKVEEVCQVRLDLLDERERYKDLTKRHTQFVHP